MITKGQCEIFSISTSKYSMKHNRFATRVLKFDLKTKRIKKLIQLKWWTHKTSGGQSSSQVTVDHNAGDNQNTTATTIIQCSYLQY